MTGSRTAREVFDDWARDHHADGMERGHRPRVEQAWRTIPDQEGNYLEVGVGNGYGIRHMATGPFRHGHCVGLDLSPPMAERARDAIDGLANARIECGDFLTWRPEFPQPFALIFSMEVFYYFSDIQKGIDHAVELLEPGGTLMVLVNFYREHQASHRWPGDLDTPMTLWSAAEYRAGFERSGLVDVSQEFYFDPPEVAEPGDPGTLATRGRRQG